MGGYLSLLVLLEGPTAAMQSFTFKGIANDFLFFVA